MRFLRRNAEGTADEAETVTTPSDGGANAVGARGRTTGKGRPTPKRRDAETRRRGPAPPPPRTQREAIKLSKANRAARKQRQREKGSDRQSRMPGGDQKALMPRDRGPVKAFVRDVVDSRRHLIGFFMPLAGVVFVSLLVPSPVIKNMVSLFVISMMLVMAAEGVLLGRRVTGAARVKFPKESISTAGLSWYAFARASQIRRLRVPKPKVAIGDTVDGAP